MLLRQTLLYLPSQLAGPAMQFAFAIVWTHWLSQADYGLLTLLIASQEVIFLCCVSWWSFYVLRFFGGAGEAAGLTIRRAEPLVLEAVCLPLIVLNLAVLTVLGEIGNVELLLGSTGYVVGRSLVTYFGERIRTKANVLLYTVVQMGSLAAGGALGFLFMVLFERSAAAVMAGFAVSHMAVALWLVWRLGVSREARVYDATLMRKAAQFGLPLVAAGVINWVNLNGIRVVIETMGGAASVGLLAVGWGLGQRLTTTAAMFVTTAAFPLAARSLEQGAREDALSQLEGGGTLLVALIVPAAVGLCLVTPPFVRLTIAEPFQAVTLSILPLAVATGAIRNIRVHYADSAFILFDRTKMSVLVNSVEAVAMIAFCAFGYAWDGIFGAVAGACVASSGAALLGFALARPFGLPLPLADWFRIVLAAATMAAIVANLSGSLDRLSDPVALTLKVTIGAIVYALALACLFPTRLRSLGPALRRQPGRSAPANNPREHLNPGDTRA